MAVYQPSRPLEYSVYGQRSFVTIGRGLDCELTAFLGGLRPDAIAVITDTTVEALHSPRLASALSLIDPAPVQVWVANEPGEESKTLASAGAVLERLLPHLTRDSVIVAFGGGAVGNLAGTVASLLYRGTRFLHVPTTFMAQADSAIGIKQAVNAVYAKNAFGAYHTPLAVFGDLAYLDTLPIKQWRNGVAETIKVAVARDPALIRDLLPVLPRLGCLTDAETCLLLERTIYAKLSGLEADPHERNTLLYLEIGHTVGHAIERASDGSIPHGEAIALGMLIETRAAIDLGISTADVYDTLHRLFRLAGLPTEMPANIASEAVLHSIRHDNRRVSGGPLFVFAEALGRTRTQSGVDLELVRACVDSLREHVTA